MYIIFVSNNAATHNKLLQKIDNFILSFITYRSIFLFKYKH